MHLTSWILTTGVMVGVLFVLFAVGLTVAGALSRGRRWSAEDWIDAPFLGIAAIVVVLQIGVYSQMPLRLTAWPFVAIVIAAFALLAWRGRFNGAWAACPKKILVVASVVLAVQGFGLWTVGVRAYTGRAWGDQINYGMIAQNLVDSSLGSAPDIAAPVALISGSRAQTRIGQSVLQGFFSVLFPLGMKALFEPTILLSPLLVSLALVGFGMRARLPARLTICLGALGGLLPAVALVHLESFLSHALALPLVLYLPIMLDRASASRAWGDYCRAGLLLASTTAIYLEMFMVLEACVVIFFVVACFGRGRQRTLTALTAVAVSPWVLGMTRGFGEVLAYMGRPVLGELYPWALSLEGVQRLWAGDLVSAWWVADAPLPRALAVGLLATGYLGLLRHLEVEITRPREGSATISGIGRPLCLLALACLPLAVLVQDAGHPYQFYKLLLTMAPAIVWGAGYAVWSIPSWMSEARREWLAVGGSVAVAVIAVSGTVVTAKGSTEPAVLPRHNTVLTLDRGFLEVEQRLRQTAGRDIVSCISDPTPPNIYANGWLTLFAHRNRTWVLNPFVNDNAMSKVAGVDYFSLIPGTLHSPLVLTSTSRALWARTPKPFDRVEMGAYSLVTPGAEPFAFICAAAAVTSGSEGFLIPPGGVQLPVYSTVSGPAVILIRTSPDDPAYTGMGAKTGVDGTYKPVESRKDGLLLIPMHLASGVTTLDVVAPVRLDGSTLVARSVALMLAASELMTSVINPNGVETAADGKQFFWLGGGPATIAAYSPEAGICVLTLTTDPGPSVTKSTTRRLRVGREGAVREISTRGGEVSVEVPVSKGWNSVQLEALDTPDVVLGHDPRPLILMVRQWSARLRRSNGAS